MTPHTRWIAAVVITGAAAITGVFAQGGQPAPQNPPPAGQTPPPAGPGGGRGRGGGGGGGAQQGGGGQRRGGFTQYTREQAPQDVLVRGKSLYEANCASCHASDLRGTPTGANILQSQTVFNDQHGELVASQVGQNTTALP